ncbi:MULTISPECIES: hypothetical protein [Sulfurimonas]|uniref:hypothetical protein n=1 Tax=Sulfurimonas TaxID=202746 RepID=UPI001FEC00EB|nr:hypothetical protein [Sulfurimonas indica]
MMAVGPIGGAILVNQMTPAVTPVQGGQYTRFELQNIAAQAAANEKQKEIEEVRPTEENHAIDPDREHQRQEADEEMSQNPTKDRKHFDSKEETQEEVSKETTHLLDIKV